MLCLFINHTGIRPTRLLMIVYGFLIFITFYFIFIKSDEDDFRNWGPKRNNRFIRWLKR